MNSLVEALNSREKVLDSVIGKINRSRKKAPEGRIRICKNARGRVQYYLMDEPNSKVGKYIKKKDHGVAFAIVQKEYNKHVLTYARLEKNSIIRFRKKIQSIQFEDVYPNLCKDRQNMITPIVLPDDEFVKKWLSVEYERLAFNNSSLEFYSQKGERMRSKSEVIIANLLTKYNVPYLYEYPVELEDIGTVHTDFRILNVRKRKVILWEHYGLMDDRDYRSDKIVEIEKYHKSGYFLGENFIFTMETARSPLNTKYVEQLIKHYCL